MNIFDSYIDAGQKLNKRDREQYYTALVEFIAYDFEPKLKGAALAVFTAIRPSLELSKQRANSGRKGGNSHGKTEANGEAKAEAKSKSMSKSKESPNGDSRVRFAKPTVEQVSDYAAELGNPTFDAAHFIDYYESNGWKVGRNPMKDWKATVRNWVRKDAPKKGGDYHAEYD